MASVFSTIVQSSKLIWYRWSFHGAVLISLFLQIFLFFMAPLRRRTERIIIIWLIFGAYLMADWSAAFAFGLISYGQGNDKYSLNKDLAAFWAAFLLLHLGGPDSITAFSLEDNDLWRRHLVGLLARLGVVSYIFFRSVPNELQIPIVLVLIVGTIKYGERTRALYLACLANSKKSMLPKDKNDLTSASTIVTGETHRIRSGPSSPTPSNQDDNTPAAASTSSSPNIINEDFQLVEIRASNSPNIVEIMVDAGSSSSPNTTNEFELLENAYSFYETFNRVLIVDLKILTTEELKKSERYFLETAATEAFRVMEVELNFMYDSLYTKMAVVHCPTGYLLRFLCFVMIVVSFALFAYSVGEKFDPIDVTVTYFLLVGAVGLELATAVQLIFSDWIVTLLETSNENSSNHNSEKKIVSVFRKISRPERLRLRRWSNSVSQHSFINYCIHERFERFDQVADFFGLRDFLDNQQYITTCGVENDLKEFIFKELKEKKAIAKSDPKISKEICSARGEWALKKSFPENSSTYRSILEAIPSHDSDYIDCLLRWHVATELCYFTSDEKKTTRNKPRQVDDLNLNDHRGFCKVLSQYMLYLLVMRPTMIPEGDDVGRMRFLVAYNQASNFFLEKKNIPANRSRRWWGLKFKHRKKLQKASMDMLREIKNEGNSFPFLKDACRLARELEKLKDNKWKVMSKVWAELLAYAAIQHKVNTAHAQQLNRGGEFITFVWLLTAHFGFREPGFWMLDHGDVEEQWEVNILQPPPE